MRGHLILGDFMNQSAAEIGIPVHMKKRAAEFAAHSLYYSRWSNVGDAITPS